MGDTDATHNLAIIQTFYEAFDPDPVRLQSANQILRLRCSMSNWKILILWPFLSVCNTLSNARYDWVHWINANLIKTEIFQKLLVHNFSLHSFTRTRCSSLHRTEDTKTPLWSQLSNVCMACTINLETAHPPSSKGFEFNEMFDEFGLNSLYESWGIFLWSRLDLWKLLIVKWRSYLHHHIRIHICCIEVRTV
jgi:hypothetical protein